MLVIAVVEADDPCPASLAERNAGELDHGNVLRHVQVTCLMPVVVDRFAHVDRQWP